MSRRDHFNEGGRDYRRNNRYNERDDDSARPTERRGRYEERPPQRHTPINRDSFAQNLRMNLSEEVLTSTFGVLMASIVPVTELPPVLLTPIYIALADLLWHFVVKDRSRSEYKGIPALLWKAVLVTGFTFGLQGAMSSVDWGNLGDIFKQAAQSAPEVLPSPTPIPTLEPLPVIAQAVEESTLARDILVPVGVSAASLVGAIIGGRFLNRRIRQARPLEKMGSGVRKLRRGSRNMVAGAFQGGADALARVARSARAPEPEKPEAPPVTSKVPPWKS